MENRYIQYFSTHNQIGGTLNDIGRLYKANKVYQQGFGFTPSIVVQEGQGLGAILNNLYHIISPLLKSSFNALGSEAKIVGRNILRDMGTKPIANLLKEHGSEALTKLTDKAAEKVKQMQGKGFKKKRVGLKKEKKTIKNIEKQTKRTIPKRNVKRTTQTKKNKKPSRILDIFD